MATRWFKEENGTMGEFVSENGKIHKRTFNPQRTAQLEQNKQVRQGGGTRMMDWGKMICDIPEGDLPMLRHFFGIALFNNEYDKFERKAAREKFLKSPASDPYRVEERKRR